MVVDLDFADLMHEGELKSICGQLAYSWHANCAAQQPMHLALTSVQVSEWAWVLGVGAGCGLQGALFGGVCWVLGGL